MIKINENYLKLQTSYLFSDIAKRVNNFAGSNPDREIIRLGKKRGKKRDDLK